MFTEKRATRLDMAAKLLAALVIKYGTGVLSNEYQKQCLEVADKLVKLDNELYGD